MRKCARTCACSIGVEILGYFMGLYYFVQVLLELGAIGGLLYTTYRFAALGRTTMGHVLMRQVAGLRSRLRCPGRCTRQPCTLRQPCVVAVRRGVASAPPLGSPAQRA